MQLVQRLELSDEEALAIFELDAARARSRGEVDHRPEVAILEAITARGGRSAQRRRCCRAGCAPGAPGARPLDLLLAGDFTAFEDALASASPWLG